MNVDGRRFEDVTTSSGTGHLRNGHGVSFADWDWTITWPARRSRQTLRNVAADQFIEIAEGTDSACSFRSRSPLEDHKPHPNP
jgi:hypothetical protein